MKPAAKNTNSALLFIALVAGALSGCSGLASLDTPLTPSALQSSVPGLPPVKWSLVALPPITGAPAGFTDNLIREINAKAKSVNIGLLVDPTAQADVKLQGSLTMTRDSQTAKIFYRWDAIDAKGALLQRVEGVATSVVPKSANEPWVWVSPAVIAEISNKAVSTMTAHARQSEIVSSPVATAPAPAQ